MQCAKSGMQYAVWGCPKSYHENVYDVILMKKTDLFLRK